jgi:hypothetical protein
MRRYSKKRELKTSLVDFDSTGFVLSANESIIWLFENTDYLEDKLKRHYSGSSGSVSVRIAKGFTVRTGGSRGGSTSSIVTEKIDTGILALTNKNLFFSGEQTSFKLPYKKIISFQKDENGIRFHKNTVNARQQYFITDDDWFLYNLLVNLVKIS